jgi:hypothetical protein
MCFNCDITVATNVWPLLDCSINGGPNWVKIVISLSATPAAFFRVQVDLIDMKSRTDNDFRYIMHARDQFSKFSWAYPLVNKNAAGVAERLMTIFTQFGTPSFLVILNPYIKINFKVTICLLNTTLILRMYKSSINDTMISPDVLQL